MTFKLVEVAVTGQMPHAIMVVNRHLPVPSLLFVTTMPTTTEKIWRESQPSELKNTATTTRSRLLEALLHEALGSTLATEAA